MKLNSWPTLIVLTIFSAAYSMTALGGSDIVTVPLTATPRNAGNIARAVLVPQGNGTAMTLIVGGVPNSTALPPHIYTYVYPGSCGSLGVKAAYTLNQRRVLGDRVPNRSNLMSKYVPVSMGELTSSDYAVVLRTSPADGNVDIFCGNLKRAS